MKALQLLVVLAAAAAAAAAVVAPDNFFVEFATTASDAPIVLNVTRAYAPHGVDRFFELLTLPNGSYYAQNGFFRVVPGFVVQFGINGDPAVSHQWRDATIPDDPVILSNVKGTVSFATAGANTRTTQLFINYVDNSSLDSQGFSPFAYVIEGMDVAVAINSEYGQKPSQGMIYAKGNAYLEQSFPNLDYLVSTTIRG
eukprot:TRINITY_DN1767_c0_g1_i1.p2 TRINITY_DN1767_c0_g1~~TRINITY_DN1767_c0_g1_i1.p2  ORF type:complete len:222 (+),score=51.03 TRINITY_DN1767_c0_g1_i1:75-668(+)